VLARIGHHPQRTINPCSQYPCSQYGKGGNVKRPAIALVVALSTGALVMTTNIPTQWPALPEGSSAMAQSSYQTTNHQSTNPCAPPNEVARNPEQTAWELWVAATCPVNQNQYPYVVWENWIEQTQMYPTDPSQGLIVPNSGASATGLSRVLHGSPLALAKNPLLATTVPGNLEVPIRIATRRTLPPPISRTW
jgi:hypothetical protein